LLFHNYIILKAIPRTASAVKKELKKNFRNVTGNTPINIERKNERVRAFKIAIS
jgi:hypothetical protein